MYKCVCVCVPNRFSAQDRSGYGHTAYDQSSVGLFLLLFYAVPKIEHKHQDCVVCGAKKNLMKIL